MTATVWRRAAAPIAAALAANAVIVVLTELFAPVPLLTAMLGTFTFAGVWLGLSVRLHAGAPWPRSTMGQDLDAGGLTMAGVLLGTWLLVAVVGDGRKFYCEPAVPWRMAIAMFGSFAVGLWTRMEDARGRARLVYPLTVIALIGDDRWESTWQRGWGLAVEGSVNSTLR